MYRFINKRMPCLVFGAAFAALILSGAWQPWNSVVADQEGKDKKEQPSPAVTITKLHGGFATIMPDETEKGQTWMAYKVFRDPMTGNNLVFSNRGVSAVAGPKNYEFRTTATADGELVMMRVNSQTGESWIFSTKASQWTKVAEEKAVPEGDYDVVLQKARDSKSDFFMVRMDRRSGKIWVGNGSKWTELKEVN